jgi:hypothetical protein
MSIPKNITRAHILKALLEIEKMPTIPARRNSKRYFLVHSQKRYPPKLVISIANKYANGEELDPNPSIFNTYQAQDYLRSQNFNDILDLKKK